VSLRIGQGYDIHAFGPPAPGATVWLGGVEIGCPRPLIAHSDGDVLLHALCDAVLGAAGLRDIGYHFPDTDARWAGVQSRVLLRECVRLVVERGWRVVNADCSVMAEYPRLAPHVPLMCDRMAEDLRVEVDAVAVKATTQEGLGAIGRGEGIAALAVVLLARPECRPRRAARLAGSVTTARANRRGR